MVTEWLNIGRRKRGKEQGKGEEERLEKSRDVGQVEEGVVTDAQVEQRWEWKQAVLVAIGGRIEEHGSQKRGVVNSFKYKSRGTTHSQFPIPF